MELRILVGSWNVNGLRTIPCLDDWLVTKHDPDIVAVGLQELSSDILEAGLVDDATNILKLTWEKKIRSSLGEEYRSILLLRCGWAGLIIFMKKVLAPLVKRVESSQITCGFNNMLGNKCGIGARFEMKNGQSFVLVTAHLAAHQHKVYKRNEDYRRISHCLSFMGSRTNIRAHSHVIWFGDLNYRLETSYENVKLLLTNTNIGQQNAINRLLSTDQLNHQRSRKLAFQNYAEGRITFVPTYKYVVGTDMYTAERVPSWTDRVLYRGEYFKLMSYSRHPTFCQSDHKPISARFTLNLRLSRSPTPSPTLTPLLSGRSDENAKMFPSVPEADLLHLDLDSHNLEPTSAVPAQTYSLQAQVDFSKNKAGTIATSSAVERNRQPNTHRTPSSQIPNPTNTLPLPVIPLPYQGRLAQNPFAGGSQSSHTMYLPLNAITPSGTQAPGYTYCYSQREEEVPSSVTVKPYQSYSVLDNGGQKISMNKDQSLI
eukprot:CFRG2331T1